MRIIILSIILFYCLSSIQGQTCLSYITKDYLRKFSINVYKYEPAVYTESCCAVTMQFMDSIFEKSLYLAMIHPIFSMYLNEYPDECTILSLIHPYLRLACYLNVKFAQANDFIDQINVVKGNKQYEIAYTTAKLQYKSIHAFECLYGSK
ncbi:hypothetical protein I4U23_016749 [Adineta vaga]|nr:hypothetical protein I4U23_016749 [Adineta vaga]